MPLIAFHWTLKRKAKSRGRSLNTKESPLRLGIDQIKCRCDRLKLRQYIYDFFRLSYCDKYVSLCVRFRFSPCSSLRMQEEGGAYIARILRPYQVTRE